MLCRAATLAAERDSLEERLASCKRQTDARARELEAATREWQEKAYAAQEEVRSLAAELQQLRVSLPSRNVQLSNCACARCPALKMCLSSCDGIFVFVVEQDAAAHRAAQPVAELPVANGPVKGNAPAISQAVVEIAASPAVHPLPGLLRRCMLVPSYAAVCSQDACSVDHVHSTISI